MDIKPTIILDFDDVLFNRQALKEDIFNVVKSFGISSAKAKVVYKHLRSYGVFPPRIYASLLFPKNKDKQKKFLIVLNKLVTRPKAYNFKGVDKFVKSLHSKYELNLLTYGSPSWQKLKVQHTGLTKFFSKIYFTKDNTKRENLRKIAVRTNFFAVLLDDNKGFCNNAKDEGLKAIKVKAGSKDWEYYKNLINRVEKIFT